MLALPVLNLHTKQSSFTDLPKSLSIVKTYNTIQASFPGSQDPAHLVVRANDVTTPQFAKAYAEFKKRALATGVIQQPIRVAVNKAKTVARVDFPLAGEGQDATAVRALATLRTEVIPPVLATLPAGTEQAVTGATAANVDFNKTMKSRAPIVFAFVLGFAFLLLLVTFRSIVIPIKAIILNLLSVGAAYGVLVWIFQYGHLQGLLGFHSSGAVVTWLPLFLFTVLFGLSMDYHVFILSRVKELVDQGVPTDQAVERGIRCTASTVTSAAAVMIAVFAIFATLSALDIKQLGVGLAVAVFIDATLIRGVLLPAAMKLLGEWNWYLPHWLEWMPELNAEAKLDEDVPSAPPVPGRMIATERYDVAVIGGGQAGLAIGYFLKRQGKRFVIFDGAGSIGAGWRARWDSLVLFTPRRYDSLPGLPFPGDRDGYPTRDEVVAYLEDYRGDLQAAGRAPQQGPFHHEGRRCVSARHRRPNRRSSPGRCCHRPLPDAARSRLCQRARARGVPDSQPGLSSAQRRAGGLGAGRWGRQHRLPDRRRAFGDA